MRKLQKMSSLEACPENSERGGWDTFPHASYIDPFLFFQEGYKCNTQFQKKRGGRSALGPPLDPPLITKINIISAYQCCIIWKLKAIAIICSTLSYL